MNLWFEGKVTVDKRKLSWSVDRLDTGPVHFNFIERVSQNESLKHRKNLKIRSN